MMSVVSYVKTLATISKEHGAELSLYTPNNNATASVVITLLPSANVTTNVYLVSTRYPIAPARYPIAPATALVTKL